jgi:lycopene cyclase domain-containing protein
MSEYLLVLLVCFLPALAFSLHPNSPLKPHFWLSWLAILWVAPVWIIWDIYATYKGHWSFNPNYVSDLHIFGLPFEEILFFLLIPYACIFVWTLVRDYDSIGELWESFWKYK